ncbi:hypothetical protein B0T25DRAFT_188814 [Lasiosphaeria hispida]|uniref:ShKT domain-containing protein n=1 Tax=Lasiosphaeria hispida TaxID=260671 RepID=A0AAJ0HH45_9PEZI|nr:hypothetical protein B0T25DRAFT_188814 [Lasiosphaeria hispida]
MKSILRTLAATSALLLFLSPAALAVPIAAEDSVSISNATIIPTSNTTTIPPQAPPKPKGGANITSIDPDATVQGGGSPQCKPPLIYDLCTAANARAYCDNFGTFHSNFPKTCIDCWCQ